MDPYTQWKNALAGEPMKLERVQDAEGFWWVPPVCGFFQHQKRDGSRVGVAVWIDGDQMFAEVDRNPVTVDARFSENVFAFATKRPVTEEAYFEWRDNDRWPDDVPEVTVFTSNASPHEQIKETIEELRKEADKWLASIGGKIETQELADKAGNFADRFAELAKEAEEARKAEKAPYLEKGKAIDETWRPVKELGDTNKTWAKGLVTNFLRAEQKRKFDEAQKKFAEGEVVKSSDLKVKAGSRGRGVSLTTRKELKVEDFDALWKHFESDNRFRNNPDVVRILTTIAKKDLDAEKPVPGARLVETQEAR